MQKVLCEGFEPHEIGADNHGRTVMGSIMIRWGVGPSIIPVLIMKDERILPNSYNIIHKNATFKL